MALGREILTERRSPKRYRISLTPLADAMFNLLIFFMLSSNITPYSLLPLKGTTALPGADAGAAGAEAAQPFGAETAVWTISEGQIIAGGQEFGIERIAELTQSLTLLGTTGIVLIVRPEAKVQDLTSVLEALSAGGITQVQLAGRGGV
ncbi:MAG: biopolymer transporter ExbD [Rhodobacteraceae bacterium]|jgi:biopolymer transport protein ExbD|nr:biopolymer transporter ExbD [Paracoccaceae bacterium]